MAYIETRNPKKKFVEYITHRCLFLGSDDFFNDKSTEASLTNQSSESFILSMDRSEDD